MSHVLEAAGIDAYIATGRDPHNAGWEAYFAQAGDPPAENGQPAREDGVQTAHRRGQSHLSPP